MFQPLFILDFNITVGDLALMALIFFGSIGIVLFSTYTFVRHFRKEGTGAHFFSQRIFPKLIVLLLFALVLYALFS